MIRGAVVLGLLLTFVFGGAGTARTANGSFSSVPKVTTASSTISASVLAPAACTNRAGLTTVTVASGATLSGGAAAELLLGRNTATTINGGNGNDCLIGGAGIDALNGQGNTDVCIGNGSTDTFNAACETQIQ
ncbi:MAG: hypothetical protein WCI61_09190 [Chloroflexota bacterium]